MSLAVVEESATGHDDEHVAAATNWTG